MKSFAYLALLSFILVTLLVGCPGKVTGDSSDSGIGVSDVQTNAVLDAPVPSDAGTPCRDASLSGEWRSSDLSRVGAGDWSSVVLTLEQSGTSLSGDILTKDGYDFVVSGSAAPQCDSNEGWCLTGYLDVNLHLDGPDANPWAIGECWRLFLGISQVGCNELGNTVTFSGNSQGRCYGDFWGQYQFER